MRVAIVVCALVAAPAALAAPARSCRVVYEEGRLDASCLPAISAKGTLVAVAEVDPDAARRLPNLEVVFIPLDGRPPARTVVLTVAEAAELGKAPPRLLAVLEPRLDLVNAQLAAAGFAPLAPAENVVAAVKDGVLEVRGRDTGTETAPLPAGCAGKVGGVFAVPGAEQTIVVKVDGAASGCAATWRAVKLHGKASPADDERAGRLNTRGMRRLKAGALAAAAADFRAAIAASGDHVKAHYNLACVASLQKDRATAVDELRWLAASPLAEARAKLVKARTDPDLAFARTIPEAKALLEPPKP